MHLRFLSVGINGSCERGYGFMQVNPKHPVSLAMVMAPPSRPFTNYMHSYADAEARFIDFTVF